MNLTAPVPRQPIASIDPSAEIGLLALSVADLARSITFYTEAIGFSLLARANSRAIFGVAGRPLLILSEQPGAKPWPRGGRSYTGLYHFAILVPSRADLGRWLHHWLELGLPLPGQGDHLVSEALYLEDPDGHGIEVYRDRPRGEWSWDNGHVRMAVDPVDIQGLLTVAERSGEPWQVLATGSRIGHMHLQVGDIPQAVAFYQSILGFDIVAEMPSALFVSAGGYHHHIGMNVWHSRGQGPAPAETVRLRFFTVDLPSEEARRAVIDRVQAAGLAVIEMDDGLAVRDPWRNTLVLQVGGIKSPDVAASLSEAAQA